MNTHPPDRRMKICHWCRYMDEAGPFCRRLAPRLRAPMPSQSYNVAEWPIVNASEDFCGEFREGNFAVFFGRRPRKTDLDDAQ